MNKKLYRIVDWSWNLRIWDGELIHLWKDETIPNEFELLYTDCKLPADGNLYTGEPVYNDTIIRNTATKEIVFTLFRFLRPVTQYCECCGQRKP